MTLDHSFTRAEILERLHKEIAAGRPIVGAGSSAGIVAKAAERGGADMIIIYSTGRSRIMGLPTTQIGHSNTVTLDMFDEIAAGQALSARVDCIAAMRGLLDDALDPGIMGVVGQDAVAPLAVYPTANDPALVQLFLDEAGDILDGADQALAQWAQDPDNHSALSTLQHDLQTLKGGAQMAGVGAVEVLAHALVALYEGLVDRRLGATAELLDLLRRGHQTLGQMLHALREGQAPASATALLGELREYRHAPPAPAAVEAAADEAQRSSDNELLEVFLEESSDIVESAAAALARWQADPRNSVEVENLLRDLHTLKGGARMVEIAAIGDLAHELVRLVGFPNSGARAAGWPVGRP